MTNYLKLCMMLDVMNIDPSSFEVMSGKEVREIVISYPDSIDIIEYLKQACKDCRTYAFVEISKGEFESSKRKYSSYLELSEKQDPN